MPKSSDKSGRIRLSVRVPKLPAGGRIRWSVSPNPPGHTGSITFALPSGLTSNVAEGDSVEILGLKPGRTAVDVEARDASDTRVESQKYQLMVPQFVTVDEHIDLQTVLDRVGLGNSKEFILREARETCDKLLAKANVRTVWFGEKLPTHLTQDLVTKADIAGDPIDLDTLSPIPLEALFGEVRDRNGDDVLVGPDHFDEVIGDGSETC